MSILLCPRCGRVRLPSDESPKCVICFTTLVDVQSLLRMAAGNSKAGKTKMAAFQKNCAEVAVRFANYLERKAAAKRSAA